MNSQVHRNWLLRKFLYFSKIVGVDFSFFRKAVKLFFFLTNAETLVIEEPLTEDLSYSQDAAHGGPQGPIMDDSFVLTTLQNSRNGTTNEKTVSIFNKRKKTVCVYVLLHNLYECRI